MVKLCCVLNAAQATDFIIIKPSILQLNRKVKPTDYNNMINTTNYTTYNKNLVFSVYTRFRRERKE